MICASRLAESLGRVNAQLTDRQRRLLLGLGLPIEVAGLDPEQLLAAMQHDKKTEQGQLRFVLPDRLGHVELVAGVDAAMVRQVL
jgi:3-dehydroquinate synthase